MSQFSKIWVRHFCPLSDVERGALEHSLDRTYGSECLFYTEWINRERIGYLVLEDATKTTVNKVADALRMYLHSVIYRQNSSGGAHYDPYKLEVEISNDRPAWAEPQG